MDIRPTELSQRRKAQTAGAHEIEVSGVDTCQITVGERWSWLALPGVLAGLAIAGSLPGGRFALRLFVIGAAIFVSRSNETVTATASQRRRSRVGAMQRTERA